MTDQRKHSARWFHNLICYCGLEKDEYYAIRKDAFASNFDVWKYLHVLVTFAFMIILLLSVWMKSLNISSIIQIVTIAYSAICSLLFFFVFKRGTLLPQFLIYGTMALLMLYALYSSMARPAMMGVTFMVMLVLLPMFMIDRPFVMIAFLGISVAVYNIVIGPVKAGQESLRLDLINSIAYGALGGLINTFYNYLRVREFVMRNHEKQYTEEQQRAAEETRVLNTALQRMSDSLIEIMGDVVESRDPDSGNHINRVKGYTAVLAGQVMRDLPEYGLDDYTVDLIVSASALHDVGKIAISDTILNKPGKLTQEEFEIMKTHCAAGCRILSKMKDRWSEDYLQMGLDICGHHHEKWDGRGYPDGLKGDEIPIAAQIVSAADIFDALTTKRVYKDAYDPETAFSMIMNGECGAFSDKLLGCLNRCREGFMAYLDDPSAFHESERPFELISRSNPEESFVLGFHDQDRTLREKARLDEELSVLGSLSEEFLYVCYVNMPTNEVIRFRADKRVERMLDSFGDSLRSNERFDRMLNSIIVAEDYQTFRQDTDRDIAMAALRKNVTVSTDFRVRLEDGIHYCRMKISPDKNDPNAVIIGILIRDAEQAKEAEYIRLQQELAVARSEMKEREKLEDRLAVINCLSGNYDYVCSLNARTMEVVVYRAADWMRDMFKNLEDIVVSPEARTKALKGIIHPDDFERFQEQSRHENVLAALRQNGSYAVNYRAFKYGKPVQYQTRYTIDQNNPTRIIIGLHEVG